MTDNPIDFEAAKDRRIEKAIDADQARWETVNQQLTDIMAESDLSDTALISATLRALITILTTDVELNDAKQHIAKSLNCFR